MQVFSFITIFAKTKQTMKRILLLSTLLLCLPLAAQQTYHAQVVDGETGEALPYAQVYIAEGKGTMTNTDGYFCVEADKNQLLRISCVGYKTAQLGVDEIGEEIRLRPMNKTLNTVTVLPTERILTRVLKRLDKEYKRAKNRKSIYFYRLVNSYPLKQELLEAYLTAKGAGNLRCISFNAGRRFVVHPFNESESDIIYSNLQQLLEIGPIIRGERSWMGILTPLYQNISPKTGRGRSMVDTRHYTYSGEVLEDTDGRLIYRIKVQGENQFMFVDGVLYVDAATYALLSFEGELHNVWMEMRRDFLSETSHVCPIVRITYSHDNGYTEVESVVVTMEIGNLESRALAFNLGTRQLPFNTSVRTTGNMIDAVDAAGYDSTLWQDAVVLRTSAENHLIEQQILNEQQIHGTSFVKEETTNNRRQTDIGALYQHLSAFGKTIPQEKVYVHMDNTCYFQGDTIWFAAYTRQTTDDHPSRVSGVLYVELLNNDGYLVERKLIEMKEGRGNGFFALNKQIQYSGFYELRAFTRWQLNWGCFEHPHSEEASQWFISKDFERDYYRDYEKVYSRVFPVYDRPSVHGDYDRMMSLRPLRRQPKITPPTPTLMLFPEGGNLVAGVENRVAFEASMSDGQWLEGSLKANSLTPSPDSVASIPRRYATPNAPLLTGICPNAQTLTRVAPRRGEVPAVNRGRGVFTIVPERGMEREVTFTTEDGQTVKARLPKPEERGVALQVRQEGDSTHIVLHLAGVSPDSLGLTIMHEGKVSLLRTMTKGLGFSFHNSTMPCGVNQVTVFDTEGHVWADRLFFVRKREEMQPTLDISGMKDEYQPYEPITLDVQQSDALYDNANIMTEMLLSSEIRGFVPDPGWYFEADDSLRRTALDLLMMTQGWRRFNWRDMAVRGTWKPTEPDEKAPMLTGEAIHINIPRMKWMMALGKKDSLRTLMPAPKHLRLNPESENTKDVETQDGLRDKNNNLPESSRKNREVRVYARFVPLGSNRALSTSRETSDGKFHLQLPRYYGTAAVSAIAIDTTKMKKVKSPDWNRLQEDSSATTEKWEYKSQLIDEYFVKIHHPRLRFVRPYSYYQTHVISSRPITWRKPVAGGGATHELVTIDVRPGSHSRQRFNDAFPALIVDAYEAAGEVCDAGLLLADYPVTRYYVADYGLTFPYVNGEKGHDGRIRVRLGLGPTRRSLPQYIGIPADSIYAPKYLASYPTTTVPMGSMAESAYLIQGAAAEKLVPTAGAEEVKEYMGLHKLDKFVIYTDYSPRMEGSSQYSGTNLPETDVVIYPYADGHQRVSYKSRYMLLPGFAAPAEFYSPDYSKQTLPEVPTDYRRTLYWNPNLKLDAEGRARVTLYNNSRTTQIQVDAAGQAADGTLLWNR